jgi:hypothetical protein
LTDRNIPSLITLRSCFHRLRTSLRSTTRNIPELGISTDIPLTEYRLDVVSTRRASVGESKSKSAKSDLHWLSAVAGQIRVPLCAFRPSGLGNVRDGVVGVLSRFQTSLADFYREFRATCSRSRWLLTTDGQRQKLPAEKVTPSHRELSVSFGAPDR